MNEVKRETEIKENIIFQTDTHFLKVSKEKLDKFDDSAKSLAKLRTFIQKSMRQHVEVCKGDDWETSFRLIFKEITGGQDVL